MKMVIGKRRKMLSLTVACMLMGSSHAWAEEVEVRENASEAQQEENLDVYVLDDTIVRGNNIVRNPYTTGGDVNVITREDIEKHNYSDVAEALKRIPGVRIATPGYHGGEYGYDSFSSELSINGENNIVVVVDGNRISNDASAFAGSKASVNLATLPGIDNIEQIEVIKGSGAAIYGANAAGGVISITTRHGSKEPRTTLDLATGSWDHHRMALTHTGTADEGTLEYSFSLSHEQSGDTKYKDDYTGNTEKFRNTSYDKDNAAINIKKQLDDKRSISLNFTHAYEKAHYPITAPNYRYMDDFYNGTMAAIDNDPASSKYHRYTGLSSSYPGYRNIFLYDAMLGSYDETLTNNVSAKYVFDKTDEDAESYVRLYSNYTRYDMKDYSSIWNVPWTNLHEFIATGKDKANAHTDIERSVGGAVQLARHFGRHSLAGGFEYRQDSYDGWESSDRYDAERNLWNLYLQDKIQISKKFVLTPGLIYTHYANGTYNGNNVQGSSRLTASLYSSYDFDNATNAYVSASQIFKPVTGLDRNRQYANDVLEDETGWSYNAGISRKFSPRDYGEINFGLTDMDNAVGRYSIYNELTSKWQTRAVNASRLKRSMNVGYTHDFDDVWKFGASYSWVKENFSAKNVILNPDGTTTDALINSFRPRNTYRLNVSYDKDRWFGDLSYTIYSGNDTRYFTSSSFGTLDMALSYTLSKQWKIYLNAYNLLNTAYETKAVASYGPGALPEAGRSFMLGAKCTF